MGAGFVPSDGPSDDAGKADAATRDRMLSEPVRPASSAVNRRCASSRSPVWATASSSRLSLSSLSSSGSGVRASFVTSSRIRSVRSAGTSAPVSKRPRKCRSAASITTLTWCRSRTAAQSGQDLARVGANSLAVAMLRSRCSHSAVASAWASRLWVSARYRADIQSASFGAEPSPSAPPATASMTTWKSAGRFLGCSPSR